MYPDGFRYQVTENQLTHLMEGQARPGHFTGMLTVVLKLLLLIRPTRAYFGAKDYQQYLLIRDMALALFIDTDIIACETLREADGLAMSSRNQRLTEQQRQLAPALFTALQTTGPMAPLQAQLEQQGFVVDYLEEHHGRRFVAAKLGDVRLIDNLMSEE